MELDWKEHNFNLFYEFVIGVLDYVVHVSNEYPQLWTFILEWQNKFEDVEIARPYYGDRHDGADKLDRTWII